MPKDEPKIEEGSVLEEKDKETIEPPKYTPEEEIYISNLQKRLESAKLARDQQHEEFDNLSLIQYYQANENAANTVLKPKKNRGDIQYQSGTLRTKAMAFLSSFQGLNLKPDISAYGKDEIAINSLGNAMEDIIDKTEEVENDEEKKMLRQWELLKHGTVFVEDLWEEKWNVNKEISKGFIGKIKEVAWKTTKKLGMGLPKRTILSLLSVYLGDIRIYESKNQPYVFTVKIMNRVEVEQIYGKWDRWKNVSREKQSFSGVEGQEMVSNAWRLTGDIAKDQVEVIKYQDEPNNEFQIILNGVLMLPMGYPLSEISPGGECTIEQQNLEPIRHDFAYGKSFIAKNKNLVAILDEMMKLGVLKTQKSYSPPYGNQSGRVISKTIFRPGHISNTLKKGDLFPISEKEAQGVTPGEAGMVQELIKAIDASTSSQTFSGAKERGQVTATQIIELQRQAKIMMGILILAATLLEKKLATKRLMILLDKWFSPIDTVVDEARNLLRNRYRIVSRKRNIEDEGPGLRLTVPTEEMPTPEQLMGVEEKIKERIGRPIRITALSPEEIQSAKLTWVINIVPKDKRSSEMSKLMFSAMITDAIALGLQLNPEYIQQRFADVWGEDSNKMFVREGVEEGTAPSPGLPVKPAIKSPKVGVEDGDAMAGALR